MSDINQTSAGDYTFTLLKGGLGAIPIVGSLASEILGLLITPPLEKRRQNWMQQVGEKIKELEAINKIDITTIANNEHFIDAVLVATTFALKTSEVEKINAFKNAILNTALGELADQTKAQIFLNLLDKFTIWHIKILHFIDNPSKWYETAGQLPPSLLMGSLSNLLITNFPPLKDQQELLDVIWRDLHDNGFHKSSGLMTIMSGDGLLANRTTQLGQEFLKYISAPSV